MSDEDREKKVDSSRRRKPRSPHYKGDNAGGYGNPPVSGQFQNGGRPGPGRPGGVTSLESAMTKMLKGKVPLKNGGATDYHSALAIAARDASLKKTPAASQFGFDLVERFGPKPPDEKPDVSCLSGPELAIAEALFARISRLLPEPPIPNPSGTKIETGEGYFIIEKGGDGHLCIRRIAELSDEVVVKRAVDEAEEL